MINHIVHFVYHAVDHVAEEADHERPGPAEGFGAVVVWAAAIAGGCWAYVQALAYFATTGQLGTTDYSHTFTEEQRQVGIAALTGAGAICGAAVGLLIWWLIAFALTRSES